MRQKREKSSKKQAKPRAPRSKTKLAELEVQNKATSIPLPADYDSSLVPPDEYIVLKDIWARIQSGEISLDYAKVGESFLSGRLIYDYDLIIEVLVAAGYGTKYALKFIDSMVDGLDDAAPFPIVAITRAKVDIINSIQKLPGAQEAMDKANTILQQQDEMSKGVE